MNDNPIDQTKIHSARQYAEVSHALELEQKISELRIALQKSEERVETAEKAIEENYKKSKAQQYRWEKLLQKINNETKEIADWLDEHVPESYLPVLNEAVTMGMQRGEDGRPIRNSMYWDEPVIREDIEKELMDKMSFRTVRQLIRRQDRLSAIQHQKNDVLWKMDGYAGEQANNEHHLMRELEEKLKVRNELAEKLSDQIKKRDEYARKNYELAREMSEKYPEMRKQTGQLRKIAEGTITIPPKSTVEVPLMDILMDAIKNNDTGIATAKKLTLNNDKLRLKNTKNAELTRQAMVRVGALRREADYTPEQLIEWGKTRAQGNTTPKGSPAQIYTMQFIEKADIIGNTIEVICDQVRKGDWVDNHAQMQIAFRAGFRCPQRTGVKVLRHIKDTVYMVHFLQYDVVTDIALQVPSEPKIRGKINTHYNKYKILSCLPWHPNWTPVFERSGKIVPADVCSNSKYDVNDAIKFHRKLMDALPALPSIVPDIAMDVVGLPKDPTSATAIALGD